MSMHLTRSCYKRYGYGHKKPRTLFPLSIRKVVKMDRRAVITALVDGAFVVVTNVLALVLAPEWLPFALALCGLLQPLVLFLLLAFVIDRQVGKLVSAIYVAKVGPYAKEDGRDESLF